MKELPKILASSGVKEIETRLKSISGGRVLDVATGTGGFIDTLMKALKDYDSFVGIDYSEKEVESARKRFEEKPVEIMRMNAESLKFESGFFDTVCISCSLHHLSRINEVLDELKRVLKPGGHFLLQEMFCDGEQNEAQKTDILQHHWGAKIDSLLGITHNKTLTKQKIKDIVGNLKLREVEAFVSGNYVKCLFCEDKFECDDPRSKKIVDQAIKEVDDKLDELENVADLKTRLHLRTEGERIRKRIMKFGSAPASNLFFVARK